MICFASAWWDAWFGIDLFNKFGVTFVYQPILGAVLSVFWLGFWLLIFSTISRENIGWLLVGLSVAGGGANLLRAIFQYATNIQLNPSVVEWWFGIHIPMLWMILINEVLMILGLVLISPRLTHLTRGRYMRR